MNVLVLSHLAGSPGTVKTIELFEKAGCTVRQASPDELHLTLFAAPGAAATIDASPLEPRPDLVYPRLGSSAPPRALDVLRHIEAMGLPVVNRADALAIARDKFRTYLALASAGVPVPSTVLVGTHAPLDPAIEALGPPPWIVKLPVGTKGAAVTIADSPRALRSLLDLVASLEQRVLVQRFIAEAAGTDVRVMVIDGVARLAVRRRASGDEFRSNIYLGGADSAEHLSDEVASVAEAATRAIGLDVAGVDILEGVDGPVVAEVNGSPGLTGPAGQYPDELAAVFADLVATRAAGRAS